MNRTLAAALSPLLPGEDETLLLRSCLLPGARGLSAWRALSDREPDLTALLRDGRGRLKRLSPLLLRALRRGEMRAGAGLSTVLRTAHVREELRDRAYREIVTSVLRLVDEEGVAALLLKGAALGVTVYPAPALRHSHDIDLLVRREDLENVSVALEEAGFAPDDVAPASSGELVLVHPSGLPVRLHTSLFRPSHHHLDWHRLWSRRSRLWVTGQRVAGLSPADNLLHALGHASYCPSRGTLLWACDAWFILDACPDMDWDRFVENAERSRLTLPIVLMLRYLAAELDAPIPEGVLDRLDSGARRADRFERDLALSAARQSLTTPVPSVLGAVSGLGEKLRLASWILFPSADYVRWAHGLEHRHQVPLAYLARPTSVVTSRIRSRLSRR